MDAMPNRHGAIMGADQLDMQERAVAKAERWTAGQAARLDTTPEEILEAIRERAWLPEEIEGVTSKYTLEDGPPLCEEIDAGIERIRNAPVVPIVPDAYERRRW